MHGEQDMRKMGGLRQQHAAHLRDLPVGDRWRSPASRRCAGFFSKDEILWSAFASGQGGRRCCGWWPRPLALTAFYMFRLLWLDLPRPELALDADTAHHLHESPRR